MNETERMLVDEALKDVASCERRRIRAAQAKALRELRAIASGSDIWGEYLKPIARSIGAATRAPRRSGKKGTP